MRIFLSHSSQDKAVVTEVWRALTGHVAWLDSAELEFGDILLEKVAHAIEEARDFVLFWSKPARESQWVRLELNMAFIRMLEQQACKLRVVRLDDADLPLYLRPFVYLDARSLSVVQLAERLRDVLLREEQLPAQAVRRKFVDRNEEVDRLEKAIDDRDVTCICLTGIQGIGKRSLVREALRRLFAGVDVRPLEIKPGTGLVEFALQLAAVVGKEPPAEGTSPDLLKDSIRRDLEAIHASGSFVVLFDIQPWLYEDSRPNDILSWLLTLFETIPAFAARPAILTSTRMPNLSLEERAGFQRVHITGLPSEHMESLLRYWLYIEGGAAFQDAKVGDVAGGLFGYPIAARLAAALVGQYGLDYLQRYPFHLVELRVSLATQLISDLQLPTHGREVIQAMAMIDAPVTGFDIATGIGLSDEDYRAAVDVVSAAGILEYHDGYLTIHPLFKDYFWRAGLHRADYKALATNLASSVRARLAGLEPGSVEHSLVLPAAFRLLTLGGHLDEALELRSDLAGELSEAAVILYRRRDYQLCLTYAQHVLDDDPYDWRMRLYKARAQIRLGQVRQANNILEQMLRERPSDPAVLHAMGRGHMMLEDYRGALELFGKALAARDQHVASLRDGAHCLVRLGRFDEAAELISRAKLVEPDNPFVLNIESQILEHKGEYDKAYSAMLRAIRGDPGNAGFHHRLGRIAELSRNRDQAINHYTHALELDGGLTEARFSRAHVEIDAGDLSSADADLAEIQQVRLSPVQKVVLGSLQARLLRAKGDLGAASALLDRLSRGRSVGIEILGLRADIELELAKSMRQSGYAMLANEHLLKAEQCVERGLALDPTNALLLRVSQELDSCRPM